MPAHSLCRECNGTGWVPYHSETLDGEFEEACRLCHGCYAPRRCMGSKINEAYARPSSVRYGLGYYCNEHIEIIHTGEGRDHTREAIYHLSCWLRIARDKANKFLEAQLMEALGKAETRLRHAERRLNKIAKTRGTRLEALNDHRCTRYRLHYCLSRVPPITPSSVPLALRARRLSRRDQA